MIISVVSQLERRPIYWFYGSASLAYGIKNNAFSYLLLVYANQVLGVPGYLAAAALAIAMVWDAVSDLLLGHWSDKTRSRLGRRHPFMYVSVLILPLSFFGLFSPPEGLENDQAFLYLLTMSVLIRTGTTLFEVPSTALLPDLESDYDRRNKWLALRYAFGWYGGNGIHTINFMWWVGAYGVGVQTGYSIYGAVGAVIMAIVILLSALGTQREAASLPLPREQFRFSEISTEVREVLASLKNRNFGVLFAYGLMTGIATGLGTALYIYNTTYFFSFTGPQIAFTGLCVMVSPGVAYWLAPMAGSLMGKKRAAVLALLLNITLYPVPYVLLLVDIWPREGSWTSLYVYSGFVVLEVILGIIGAILLDSMVADVVEESEVRTRRRSEGLFFAARGFASKAISAGGIVSAGTIVTLVGLDGITDVGDVTRTIREELALFFLPTVTLLHLVSLLFLTGYRIDRVRHNANLAQLEARSAT